MNSKNTFVSISVLAILVLSAIVIFNTGTAGKTETREGEGDDPYCTFNAYYLDSHYMGDQVSFRIRVYNSYDGRHWDDDDYYYYSHYLFDSKLTIRSDDVTDDEGQPKDILQPVKSGYLTPYNGPSNEGYDISYSCNYYRDQSGNYFQMSISTTNINEGWYRLPLRLSFRVARSYNDQNPGEIFYMSKFQDGYARFFVRSHVYGVQNSPIELEGREGGGPVPLYAGAKYMTLQTTNSFRRQSYNLLDFKADIDFGNEGIRLVTNRISYDLFDTTYRTLKWRTDILDTTPPGHYGGVLTFRYRIGEDQYIDGPYIIKVKVESTPILYPTNMANDQPVASIQQKDRTCGISFHMRNIGNVDLSMVTVRLDLDSATYLKQTEYRYDEGGNGEKVYEPLEFTKYDVKVETSFNVFFPCIEVYEMLPPGEYIIPIDYFATFEDPFDDSGVSSKLYSYQWDEMGEEDFVEIMWYRDEPRKVQVPSPYVILKVLDDPAGADISVDSHNILNSTSKDQRISFTVTNKELYPLEDVSMILSTTEADRLVRSGGSPGSGILLDRTDMLIPAADFNSYGTLDVNIPVDAGTFRVETRMNLTLLINFRNLTGVVQSNAFDISVIINPGEGDIDIMTTRVSEIVSERFTLYVDVINTGPTVIRDFSVLITSLDNMFTFDNDLIIMGGLNLGQKRTISFNCTLGEGTIPGATYALSIKTSMEDVNGFSKDFNDEEPYVTYVLIPDSTGKLKVISTSSSVIEPGKPFSVTVKVLNTGTARVTWSEVLLLSKDNLINLDNPIVQLDPIEAGESATATFQCSAAEHVDYSEQCCMVVRTSYRDEFGNEADFYAEEGEELNIMTSPEPKDKEMENTIRSTGLMVMIGILIAFAMISIAIVVSILLFTRAYVKRSSMPPKEALVREDTKKALPEPEKKAQPVSNLQPQQQKEQLRPYQPAPMQQEQGQSTYQQPQASQYQPAQYTSPQGQGGQNYKSDLDDLFSH